jgi:hypothetical protein
MTLAFLKKEKKMTLALLYRIEYNHYLVKKTFTTSICKQTFFSPLSS